MRKFLSFPVLLILSSSLSFGQNLNVKPSTTSQNQNDETPNPEQYPNKNVVSNSKVLIWSSTMTDSTDWIAGKMANQDVAIANTWVWKLDTAALSPLFRQYVHPDIYMKSPTCSSGLYYFDGITNLINQTYGISNSTLTNSVAINTLGYSSVSIKFYQLYKSYNTDSSLLEISSDNVTWKTIDVNPNVAVNVYAYGWKEFNISPWAANKAQVWVRFRFFAFGTHTGGIGYSGGYGWAVDDVELIEPPNNKIQVDRVTLHDGYTQIPSGKGVPMYYDADITNIGALTQHHVKLHGVALETGADSASMDTTITPMQSIAYVNTTTDYFLWNTNYFYTPSSTIGTYKVTSYISSDSIAHLALDTFSIKVVATTGMYSRDNNNYTNSYWLGSTGALSNPYTAANRYEVNENSTAYGINCVVSKDTKPGSKIRAVLYTINSATGIKSEVIWSKNYNIKPTDIPSTSPMVNPPSINLAFHSGTPAVPTGYIMEKDSVYLAGIIVYGGTDTVKFATDNTGIPQWEQTSLVLDGSDNIWYKWASGNVPAVMIRVVFDATVGINEISNSATLYSCIPNPANNTTKISYALKNSEKTTIIITDIMGRTVQTINQGKQTKGSYSVDVNLTDLTSGTYFYTLKTTTSQATQKLIIVK